MKLSVPGKRGKGPDPQGSGQFPNPKGGKRGVNDAASTGKKVGSAVCVAD